MVKNNNAVNEYPVVNEYCSMPVDLLQIAEEELINVIYDDYGYDTFDGLTMFEPSTDEFYIHINTAKGNTKNSTKGRFTLAHELGHYFLPQHRWGLMRGKMKPHGSINYMMDYAAWKIEREADNFASSLLMPSEDFVAYIRNKSFNYQLLDGISKRYNVSLSAAAIRFIAIGNYPILILYAINGKIRWTNRSQEFPFYRLRYGNGRGDRVPENTVMGSYFYEHDDSDCKREEIVYAGDCFDTYRADDNERMFKEWCIPYKDKAFSIFWE